MSKPFPIQEYKAELAKDHAKDHSELKALVQEASAKLIDQNPELMDVKVEAINKIEISLILGYSPPKGILLEYLEQEKSLIDKEICSQIEESIGQHVTLEEIKSDEMGCLLTLPSSENNRLDQIFNKTDLVENMRRHLLQEINKSIPEVQTIRPNIQIIIYLPDHRGTQRFDYIESKGKVLVDTIKPPTVTLDTNVVREWWEDRAKIEHVKKLLERGRSFEIDLAVTGRISDDIPEPPLTNRINELPSLNVHDIGSVIRFGPWKVGVDVAGNDEFKQFFDSPAVVKKLNRMNAEKRPDWRDWDHLHTHYRYKRDYFLTWDKGILHFSHELKNTLGIAVLKPEDYLSYHQ